MCGICGFTGERDDEALDRMLGALAHRGPDAMGAWHSPHNQLHFGHKRLSILDLTGGAQPMSTRDGALTITFNGEIYNFRELRAELEALGHAFSTDHSDTEVLLHGYREWGSMLPSKLNGMWAFAIYDAPRQRLFASRDRFGKKPFYYFQRDGVFVFASELIALRRHPACPSSLNEQALRKYFAYGYIPAPLSIIEGVAKLPAAHNLVIDLNTQALDVHRYWHYELEPADPPTNSHEVDYLAEGLIERLGAAVRRRMVADVPVGVFLSGGIDSSTVAALAAKAASRPIETFTIGFEEPTFDESRFAALAAAHIRSRHHDRVLSIERARELIPSVLAHLDEPLGDASILPTTMLSAFAREHVTVALGGDGGDELLAGYDPFAALAKAQLYQRLVPKPIHCALSLAVTRLPVSHRNMSLDFKLKRTLRGLDYPPQLWLPVWMAPLAPNELSELISEPVDPEDVYSEAIAAWDACLQQDLISKTIQFYVNLYLQDDILTKTDRASMMHSLEVRSPFLDIEVADFTRRLHPSLLVQKGIRKFLLKHAATSLLPARLIHRRKKGFGIPIGQWLHSGQIAPAVNSLDPPVNTIAAGSLLVAHRAGHTDHRAALWSLLALEHWSKTLPLSH